MTFRSGVLCCCHLTYLQLKASYSHLLAFYFCLLTLHIYSQLCLTSYNLIQYLFHIASLSCGLIPLNLRLLKSLLLVVLCCIWWLSLPVQVMGVPIIRHLNISHKYHRLRIYNTDSHRMPTVTINLTPICSLLICINYGCRLCDPYLHIDYLILRAISWEAKAVK